MPVTIRPMAARPADLDFAMRMKNQAGWNQVPADWMRFLEMSPQGCFIAEHDGTPAGTGVVTVHNGQLAWIGMIIVDQAMRRHGIGRSIMQACLDYCHSRSVTQIKLDATPLGNKLYLALGFVEEYLMDRREGRGGSFSYQRHIRPMMSADLPEVIAYDAAAFGVARAAVIERFFDARRDAAFIARDRDGGCTGVVLCRDGQNASQIGPWAADEPATAEGLFKAALNALGDQPVFLDTVGPNRHILPLCTRYRFVHQRPFVRMYLGSNAAPGLPERTYAVSGVEKG